MADGTLTPVQQRDAEVVFKAATIVHTSQGNVKRAGIGALNRAVPKRYKRTNGIGTANYKTNQCIREILAGLRDLYGVPTPDEKTRNEARFSAGWASGEPIEELFDRLEDCYIKSIVMQPPFTREQLLDKAKSAIQRTGLYSTAMLEWDNFQPDQLTWPIFKVHFAEAYDSRIRTGTGATGGNGYHGAFTAEGDYADDDSLASIQQSIQQSITNMHLSNNATAQATNDSVSALTAETRLLSAALHATQQQLALFTRGPPTMGAPGWPAAATAPPIPAYVPAAPIYAPPAPVEYGGRGRGGGRRRTGSRRGGRDRAGGRGGGVPAPPPPVGGAIPPPAAGAAPAGTGYQSNKVKWYNNWNYCYSCGWDIPNWHTSHTCPPNYQKTGHQVGCTRDQYDAYLAAGHKPSKVGKHKTSLPTNPQANQA